VIVFGEIKLCHNPEFIQFVPEAKKGRSIFQPLQMCTLLHRSEINISAKKSGLKNQQFSRSLSQKL